jgi:hypothetical protein
LNKQLLDQNLQKDKRLERMEYLESVAAEFDELKQAFGNDGRTSYNTAMQSIMERRNAAIQAERDRVNYQRESERIAAQEAAHEELKRQVLADNPNLQKYCDDRKTKINATKDKMLKLASEFYELDDESIKQYTTTIEHSPNESAVKHLVTQITKGGDVLGGKPSYTYFQCSYCQDKNYPSLADT